ncbi:MAG TPA: DUF3455 domain-containing protein, partial [Nevskia sp.]|nr:DUF3455 domain-containing protein [Nevskia sp.]
SESADAGAIPWLLLGAKANSGTGILGKVLSVQRLNTVGGKAAADGCDAAHTGAEQRVSYKAEYDFYAAGP